MPNLFKQLLSEIPQAEQRFIDKQLQFAGQVAHLLKIHGGKKIDFAKEAGIHPSQLTHVLSGEANPTLEFITNLEAAFGDDIILFPLYPTVGKKESIRLVADSATSASSEVSLNDAPSSTDLYKQKHGETQSSEATNYYSGIAA
jgi:transcriptional regulator with XRE-family HTH domain